MNSFPDILKKEIKKGLPGTEAQLQMAPPDRLLMNFPRSPSASTRIAAVLIPLYQIKESIFTVFIQRTEYEGVHSGQISFPGGMKEQSDKNIIETALRETYEEIGVKSSSISVIGTLTPLFIPVSDILVTPVAGWMDCKPEFKLENNEALFLIEGDLKRFLDPSIVKIKCFEVRGEMREIKYFDYNSHVIWGATAMILNELMEIIKRMPGGKYS